MAVRVRNLATEAIVLKATPFGESDRVVTLFTREAGVLSAMAKGAQRSRKRFGGTLDSLSKVQATVQWRKSNTMPLLAAASLVDFTLGLRSDLRRVAQAFYMSELIWRGTKPGVRMQEMYDAYAATLRRLASEGPDPALLAWFLLNFQAAHGYRPKLDVCSICQSANDLAVARPVLRATSHEPRATGYTEVAMSYKSGGIICSHCLAKSEVNIHLPLGALNWLRNLSHLQESLPPKTLHPSPFTLHDCGAAQQFLHRFILYHLEFQPSSWRWWQRLLSGE